MHKTLSENMKRCAISLRHRGFLHVRVIEETAATLDYLSTSTEIANSISRCATRYLMKNAFGFCFYKLWQKNCKI